MIAKKFSELFYFAPKSKVKAGDGTSEGNFAFFTSSPTLSKRLDKAQYYTVAMIFGTGGSASVHFYDEPFSTSTDCVVAIKKNDEEINIKYVYYYLLGNIHILQRGFKGAGLKHISKSYIENIEIPILSISHQNKIVSILDRIELIKSKRELIFKQLDGLLISSFFELFGDPILNPFNWPLENISKICLIIKDGPFGSNLKTEHYTDDGIRVIRLQNIGVNEFSDKDKAFISEEHYSSLKKYTCVKGDILVGTLGDPNLRACKFPEFIEKAINKADCIQIRPDLSKVNDSYLSFLLNLPSSLFLISNYIKGQTRSRISKGMLTKIAVPVPPLEIQEKFKKIERFTENIKKNFSSNKLNELYSSILQKAFVGELKFNIDFELDALIKEVDPQKSKNDLSLILQDVSYLQKLIIKLNDQQYKDKDLYDKAKHAIFQLLKENKTVVQIYNEQNNEITLALK